MELSFCSFIISLSAILFNKGLISLEEKNQTAPVINAFFKHLNNSSNATEMKIHLLDEIRKSDPKIEGNTLDAKEVNETYKSIVNQAFHPYGGIAGYLATLSKETPITTISDFKESLLKNLSENNIQNSCSSKNAASGLSALAIEKLSDYLWPDFVHQTTRGNSKNKQKREVQVLKRYKRQPPNSDSDDSDSSATNYDADLDTSDSSDLDSDIESTSGTSNQGRDDNVINLVSEDEDVEFHNDASILNQFDDIQEDNGNEQRYFFDVKELHDTRNFYLDIENLPSPTRESVKIILNEFLTVNPKIPNVRQLSERSVLSTHDDNVPKYSWDIDELHAINNFHDDTE